MLLETVVLEALAIRSFVIGDENTKECAVIDPPRLIEPILRVIQDKGLKLKAILETHVHADFISGALELKQTCGGSPRIYCSEEAGEAWLPQYTDVKVKDGTSVKLGNLTLQAKFTPGHTPEHISWICFDATQGKDPILLFSGDFLFVNGVGRPDLLGDGNTPVLLAQLHKSLFERLSGLSDSLKIYPSHGAGSLCGKILGQEISTTLGDERKKNQALQPVEMSTWITQIQEEMPSAPRAFFRNKQINLAGPTLLTSLPKNEVNPSKQDLQRLLDIGCTIDFRNPDEFAKEHLNGSINVPFGHSLGNWLAAVLPPNQPLLCILPSLDMQQQVTNLIRLLGYDQKLTFTQWANIQQESLPTSSSTTLTGQQVQEALNDPHNPPVVIDVRTPSEWNSGHIAQALHIELTNLQDSIASLPRDRNIITLCRSGMRSSIAASLLLKEGFENVTQLNGGMNAWNAASLPTTKGESHANSH